MSSNHKANDTGNDPQSAITGILEKMAKQAPAGYAIALHIRYTTPTFLFQTYPRAWMDHYSKHGFVMQDPTVLWGFENSGSVDWADLATLDHGGVMTAAAEYGIRHGVTFAFDDAGSRSIASFARSDRPFDAAEVAALEASLHELHGKTATSQGLDADTRRELRHLSVEFTHSPAT